MNHCYRLIWSAPANAWVVVSELARSKGKSSRSVARLMVVASLLGSSAFSLALDPRTLPVGGVVTAGAGSLNQAGTALTVTQRSPSLIAEWNSFNIGSQASVNFVQPNASSVALNRVLGGDPSQIFGRLNANGQVFLLNPSGVLFAPSARVEAGGLVASSLRLSDAHFLNQNYQFTASGTQGDITNQGEIRAGQIALLGARVRNQGSLFAPQGSVALAAGDAVRLDLGGDGLIQATVTQAAAQALAENTGRIQAPGGRVSLSAKTTGDALATAVNTDGLIQAQGARAAEGRIFLDAGDTGRVQAAGILDVSNPSGKGGRIVVTGDSVQIAEGARLTATGATGGGEIAVGGSWQNTDPSLHQARYTWIAPSAVLDASATERGTGGSVVAWSNVSLAGGATRAYGTFLADGGALGGDGGRIETSGHWLDTQGARGHARAPLGKAGVWLFDPYDVVIGGAASANGAWSGAVPDEWTPSATSSTIAAADIAAKLAAGTDVTITTTGVGVEAGNITVNSPITANVTAATTLRLTPGAGWTAGSNFINADITNTGTSPLHLDFTPAGSGGTTLNANLNTGGGNLTGTTLSVTGNRSIQTGGGAVSFPQTITLGGDLSLSSGGGNVVLGSSTKNINSAPATAYALTVDAGAGNIDLGQIGDTAPLSSLHVTAATTTLKGGNVTTTGTQTYVSNLNLPATVTTLTQTTAPDFVWQAGKAISYTGTGGWLTFQTPGSIIFNAGSSISTTGAPIYTLLNADSGGVGNGFIRLTNTNINTAGGTLTLSGGVNGWDYATGNATQATGVLLEGATLSTLGGILTVRGKSAAGAATGGYAGGIRIGSTASTQIDSGAGILTLSGIARGTTGDSHGVEIDSRAAGVNHTINSVNGFNVTGDSTAATTTGGRTGILIHGAAAGGSSTLTASAGPFTLTGTSSGTAPSAGQEGIILNGVVDGGTGNLTLATSNLLAANTGSETSATARGTGTLTVKPTVAASVGVGAAATGDLLLTEALLSTFQDGFRYVTLGDTAKTTTLTVNTARTFTDSLALVNSGTSPMALNSTVDVGGNTLTLTSGGTVSGSGNILANKLLLNGSGDYTLATATGHRINTIAAATPNTVDFINQQSFEVGTASPPSNVAVEGVSAATAVTLEASGAASNFTVTKGVNTPLMTLVAGGLFNNVGGGAGRYLIYAGDPTTSNIGVTGPGYNKHYNQTYVRGSTPAYASSGSWGFFRTTPTLTVSAVDATKVYGTAVSSADLLGYTGFIDGDTLTNTNLSGSAGFALTGTSSGSGNHVVGAHTATLSGLGSLANALGYALQIGATTTSTLTVTPKPLDVSVTTQNKTYDATPNATISGTSIAPIAGDVLTLGGGAATVAAFASKQVGVNKPVTLTSANYSLSGADAGNYTLVQPLASTADITRATITLSGITADNKVYDRTTNATFTGVPLLTALAGDVVTLAGVGSVAFADKAVGNGKPVDLSGYVLGGIDGSNYMLPTLSANITPAPLTITGVTGVNNKVYDGTPIASLMGAPNVTPIAGDTVTVTATAQFADKQAAVGKVVPVTYLSAGADLGNYTVTPAVGSTSFTADITPRPLTVTATGVNRVYTATTAATLNYSDDRIGGDALTLSGTASFADKMVGNAKPITLAGFALGSGGDNGNYALAGPAPSGMTANITPATLSITGLSAANKTVDGNTSATLVGTATVLPLLTDSVTLSGTGVGTFSDSAIGAGKAVSVAGLSLAAGGDASNYILTPLALTASITAVPPPPPPPPPPVVVPPVVVPPVVTPPVVVPPVVTPPVVTPPVVVPPIVTPPVVTPPIVVPPVVTPPVTPPPVVEPPVITPPVVMPPVVSPPVTTPPVVVPPVVTPPVVTPPIVVPPVVTPPVTTQPVVEPPVVTPPVTSPPVVTPPIGVPPATVTPPETSRPAVVTQISVTTPSVSTSVGTQLTGSNPSLTPPPGATTLPTASNPSTPLFSLSPTPPSRAQPDLTTRQGDLSLNSTSLSALAKITAQDRTTTLSLSTTSSGAPAQTSSISVFLSDGQVTRLEGSFSLIDRGSSLSLTPVLAGAATLQPRQTKGEAEGSQHFTVGLPDGGSVSISVSMRQDSVLQIKVNAGGQQLDTVAITLAGIAVAKRELGIASSKISAVVITQGEHRGLQAARP